MKNILKITVFGFLVLGGWACKHDPESQGLEYAPQMYHSLPYEPYTQVVDKNNEYYNTIPFNTTNANLRPPAYGTVARRFVDANVGFKPNTDTNFVTLNPDSLNWAAANLKNPLANSDEVLKDGKTLYLRHCSHCHGKNGDADGKVAPIYKGVPSYKTGRVATVSEGHIFHVITFGKGRMWPHASQITPTERWKIVHYVKKLQTEK